MLQGTNLSADVLQVKMIEIDENGEVMMRFPKTDYEGQLNRTLLLALYPDIKVIQIQVPKMLLDRFEEKQVASRLSSVTIEGAKYCLVGGTGSVKNGIFYAVDAKHKDVIAKRFQNWPQAAITYLGILLSDCRVLIEYPDAQILVVEDHVLGTNDCRGWISERYFEQLHLPKGRFYQFRLAFEMIQTKGSWKVMDNDVADLLGADLIVPKSSVKPSIELPRFEEAHSWGYTETIRGQRFHGNAIMGIREYSRPLQFKSSYTLIQYAPQESISKEILPRAVNEAKEVVSSALSGNYGPLLTAIGNSSSQPRVEDEEDTQFSSYERTFVEAVLKADGSGMLVKHPYINRKLQSMLVRWAFRLCTGGGFTMPAFALSDDGYLFTLDGKLFCGSDWIPQNAAIGAVTSQKGLVIRYPIRMKEDLLPVQVLGSSAVVALLSDSIAGAGDRVDPTFLASIVERQLQLCGAFTLHSKTAAANGGDYDFDLVSFLGHSEFPRFVESRFAIAETKARTKDKKTRATTNWWNIAEVAMKARGNQIGKITNLISNCVAAGAFDHAYRLVDELQNALDNLKHDTQVDQEVIRKISKEVPPAPWLNAKQARQISQMPSRVPESEWDRVGLLYNHVRAEIASLFEDVLPLKEFRGIVRGETVTRDMYDECVRWNKSYAQLVGAQMEAMEKLYSELQQQEQDWKALPEEAPKEQKQALYRQISRTRARIRRTEERHKEELKNFQKVLQEWGAGKIENRRGWCQALYSISTGSNRQNATGSIVFQAFPQEVLDFLIEETGGTPVEIELPELPDCSQIELDSAGNVFRLERKRLEDGQIQERRILLFRITETGDIIQDGVKTGTVQPFSIAPAEGSIREGKVTFTDIRQRPALTRTRPAALRSFRDRMQFVSSCEQQFGSVFTVFVEGDPCSEQVLDSSYKKEIFIDYAAIRPWQARGLVDVHS
jgi:hypothetical protein